jgi:predicted RNase H-like nuclease (RuvC/YqgF family)
VKRLSRKQVEGRREKAANFVETVLGDSERADEIRAESIEDYAQRRKFEINPQRRAGMPRKTLEDYRAENDDLKDQLSDLEDANEALQDQLDDIADIVSPEDEGDENDEDVQGE